MNEQLLEKPAALRNRRWEAEKPAEALKNGPALRKEQLFGENELRTLIDHLPDIISRFDRDLRCIFVSPQVADVFGVAEEKCLGKTVRETGLFNEGMLNLFKSRSHSVFESGRPETFEFSYAGPAETRYFSTRFIPEFDGEGNIASLLSIMQDITERKQVEMELQNRTVQLENLNRELESFSYSVSHDLKAPLRTIDGYSRMLLRKHSARLDEDARDMLQVIRTHAGTMGQLIDDLLAFSRVTRKDMNISEINMERLAGDVWKEIAATAGEREMEIRIMNMPSGFGDSSLVRQVLANLLANAVKFTRDRKPGIVETGSIVVNNEVIYYVRDNGVGFDMKYYEKLFGVFQRLHGDNEFEGTGVGLAIVKRIINRLGGRVWAEGKSNGGATFYFTLPVTKP